jgi:signal transduction histidine kinase
MAWMRTRYARLSLGQKFALQLTLSVVLLFAILLPSVLLVQERALFAQIEKDGTHLVQLFAYSSVQGIVADDFLLLQGAVRSIASRADIRYAMLLNLDGRVRVHSDPRQVGRALEDVASLGALRVDAPRVQEALLEDGTRAMDFAAPVMVVNRKQAVARLGISLEEPLRGIRRTRNSILLLGGLALLAGVGLALFQGRRVALPMQTLAGAARELARGKLARRIPVSSGDELGEVAAAFNRMAESLQGLFETSRQVSSSLRLHDVLHTIVQHAQRAVGSDTAAIAPYDPQAKVATVVASAGSPTPALMNLRVLPGLGLGGKVLETGKAFVTTDYLTDPRFSHRYDERVRREGIKAAAAVPLLHQGEILGILWVANRRSDPFTEEQVETLSTLASHAATALKNARLHDAAVRRGEELAALLRATQTVMAGLDLKVILERIVTEASRIAGVPHVTAYLADREAGILRPGATTGGRLPDHFEIPLGTSFSGTAATTGQPLFVADTRDDPRKMLTDRDRGFDLRTYLGLPIMVRGEAVGVLAFYTEAPREYGEAEIAYLASFADQAAIAIENARLYETLRKSHEELLAAQAERVRSARLAAVGELAAGIAHETRNPLGAISHATETLQRSLDLRGEDAELLEIIRREAARLNEIVSDFLTFGRPRPLALQETDLGGLIKDVLLAIEQDERCHRAMRFETTVDPALPRLALDPHHMSQVLWNLYLNAAQAMPGGGILRTRVALGRGPDGGEAVVLEISDTGPGIPPEAERRLFEPFFTTKPDGTGLGLPIARRIVEEHGGTLTLGPGPAGGTLARIRLPLREARTDATDPGR